MAVAVDRCRYTCAADHLAEDRQVAASILSRLEVRCRHLSGGVVDHSEERDVGEVRAEPAMKAGIDLEEHALLWIALRSGTMP